MNVISGASPDILSSVTAISGVIAIAVLVVLLAGKELAGTAENRLLQSFNRHLNVGVLPLLCVFVIIEVIKIANILF